MDDYFWKLFVVTSSLRPCQQQQQKATLALTSLTLSRRSFKHSFALPLCPSMNNGWKEGDQGSSSGDPASHGDAGRET